MLIQKQVVHKMWKQDCKCSEFGLNHHAPHHFTICFWQKTEKVKPLWIIYRIVMALYFVTTWILAFLHIGRDVKEEDAAKHFIFLTNWTYTIETMQFLLASFIVVIRAIKEKNNDFDPEVLIAVMPLHYKLYWILHTLAISASVTVTCIFWTAVYNPEFNPLDYINITTHVFNSIFMIVDFIVVAQPFRIAHIYVPSAYAMLYLLFSLGYQLSGGTGTEGKIPIYGILDWEKPERTIVTCLLAQIFLMIVHTLFWLFHKAKMAAKKNWSSNIGGKKQKEGIENLGMDLRSV